ncbi:hypothetical protein E6O75_ATG10579 [Venturia nashicola]|uniref:Uncharacterized protein n=1 Tax=Venturia nashicola TaxID=86259 RepID=A0A4Z1P276_9PEZI|nr:hypothetical protein E6O75_ATG10579 [Venturia nashicola]
MFAVLMLSDGDAIDETKPASKLEMAAEAGATIADDLPIDFFLAGHSASDVDDEFGVTHQVNTGTETLLQPVVRAVDTNGTALDTKHTATSKLSSTTTTCTTGNVASAADLNKNPYYIGTLGSCCGHYLHHGDCRKNNHPGASTCYGSPSVLCLDFQMGNCTTIKYLRHEGNLVHILPSCLVALSNGECFDDACTQGHDNFQMRRDKEEERKDEFRQHRRNDDEGIKSQLEILKCSLETGATRKQTVRGSAAAAMLKSRLEHDIPGPLKMDVVATLKLYEKIVEKRGLNGFELQHAKSEVKGEETAARVATRLEGTDKNTRKQLIMVQYAMNTKATDKQRV